MVGGMEVCFYQKVVGPFYSPPPFSVAHFAGDVNVKLII